MDRSCGCADYTRSQLMRKAAAEAGRGLPAVETGMPLPAGTGLSRRSFISRSAGLALAVYGASALGPQIFDDGIAQAQAGGAGDVLVSVFMSGGVDSLSVLAPTGHSRYRELRPTLALGGGEGTAFAEDSSLRWHPSAAALATLHAEGKVTTFPAVGYADANQSHFTSRHFWEVGELNPFGRVGWLGRFLDQHGTSNNPLQGLSLGYDLAPSLATGDKPVAAVYQVDDYDLWAAGVWSEMPEPMLAEFARQGSLATGDPALASARDATASTARLRDQLKPFQDGYSTPGGVTYPRDSDFGRRLSGLAAMLDADLPLKAVAIEAPGGYDTHSDQASNLPNHLKETCDGLLAFQRDIEARGLADRVLVHVWSEFGRRPQENGSGTDHGAGGTSFVIGSRAKGEMVGEFPGLTSLDSDDNLRHTADFRHLYCSLLEQWFDVDAASVIPGASGFSRPTLVG